MRTGPVVVAFTSLFLLAGCSLLPQLSNDSSRDDDDEESSESVELSARDLDGFFDADDAPAAFRIDLAYEKIDGSDWVDEVEGYWDDAEGSEDDCFESYSASYLIGGKDDDENDHVKIAVNDSESDYSYVSVDGRVFGDADAAGDYLDAVEDAAADCDDAGGYLLYSEDGEAIWEVTGASVEEADDLDLPEGVRGIIQEEDVEPDFAQSYRVIMLQRGNVVVAVTVQPSGDGEFDEDDGDKLAELVAEKLGDLD